MITDAATVSPSIQKTPLIFSLESVIKYKLSKRKRPEAKSESCKWFWGTLSLALVFRGSFAGAFLRQFADRFTTLGAHHSSSEPHYTDRHSWFFLFPRPGRSLTCNYCLHCWLDPCWYVVFRPRKKCPFCLRSKVGWLSKYKNVALSKKTFSGTPEKTFLIIRKENARKYLREFVMY